MSTVGPVVLFRFSAMRRPISRHSSTVVRISVTLGLCRYRVRPRKGSGTVCMARKFTMSSAPHETTCGMPVSPAAVRRSGPAESTPPTTSSHQFRGGHIGHAGYVTVADQPFHGASSGAGGVEYEHLVPGFFHALAYPVHTGGRHAEHGGGYDGAVFRRRHILSDHTADGPGGIGENAARQRVQARNIDRRIHQRDILYADIRGHVRRHDRRNHQFRDADRQGLHGGRGDVRAASSAEGQDSVEPTRLVQFPA